MCMRLGMSGLGLRMLRLRLGRAGGRHRRRLQQLVVQLLGLQIL